MKKEHKIFPLPRCYVSMRIDGIKERIASYICDLADDLSEKIKSETIEQLSNYQCDADIKEQVKIAVREHINKITKNLLKETEEAITGEAITGEAITGEAITGKEESDETKNL